ncbi:MAG TPA: hypothetical protein VIN67_08020 [Desulfobaccales bacterium]
MTRPFAEILILIPTVLGTGLLMFVAGVIQGVMNDMDEAEFQRFLTSLYQHAIRSPYALTISMITFVGAVPYLIFYGLHNWWFIAGLILWTVASVVSKAFNLPIYYRIFALESSDVARLKEERRKLQSANLWRSTLSFASVVPMVIGLA